jgi:hypothetical protein
MDTVIAGGRVKDGSKVPRTADSLTRRGTPKIKAMISNRMGYLNFSSSALSRISSISFCCFNCSFSTFNSELL